MKQSLELRGAERSFVLRPGNHCWELDWMGVSPKTGEAVVTKTTYYATLSQVGRRVAELEIMAHPSIEAGIAAAMSLADALRGMANQLEQPKTPWSA